MPVGQAKVPVGQAKVPGGQAKVPVDQGLVVEMRFPSRSALYWAS